MNVKIEDINDYSRDQLLAIAENEYHINEYPDAVNDKKPTKQEIANVINIAHKKSLVKNKPSLSERKKYLDTKVRVIITELRKPEDFEDGNENRVKFITWGNDDIGHKTDRIIFDKPWHIRRGCYFNLINAEYTPIGNGKNKNIPVAERTRKSYKVEPLPYCSKEEYKKIAENQRLRKANHG